MENKASQKTSLLSSKLKSRINFLGFIGIIGETLLITIFAILHILNSDIDPAINYISEYANSPYSALFRFSLIIHGIGMIAIATGLAISLPKSKFKNLSITFLGAASIGVILGGIFSVDPPGVTYSVAGTIHQITAIVSFPLEIGALIFFSCIFKNTPPWNSFAATTKVIAIISIVFLLWLSIAITTQSLPGLAERMAFIIFFLWETLVAIRLLKYKTATN